MFYSRIISKINSGEKCLSILIDPQKSEALEIERLAMEAEAYGFVSIMVGGSFVEDGQTDACIDRLRKASDLPIVLFPGDTNQVSNKADVLLYLSLLSGRDPKWLVDKQVEAVPQILDSELEVVPTAYMVLDGGVHSSVLKKSGTQALSQSEISLIVDTAKAGEYMGKRLVYLDAGSGAIDPVHSDVITAVKEAINIPLVIGGGVDSLKKLKAAYDAGADMVVMGNVFEKDPRFISGLKELLKPEASWS